jgi:hypothetical protein
MPFDFPASPTVGQLFSPITGVSYIWNGYAWDRQVTTAPPALIPVATAMLFQQSAAPVGWTKQTTHNDKSLRIVSGTAASGGNLAVSTVFGRTTSDAFTLTMNEIPPHAHGVSDPGHAHSISDPSHTHTESGYNLLNYDDGQFSGNVGGGGYVPQGVNRYTGSTSQYAGTGIGIYGAGTGIGISNNGSGASHSHGIDTRVLYVDAIIATKD